MRAAVVKDFTHRWRSAGAGPRAGARARCWSGSRPAGSATPTSTPPAATGRSSPPRRSSPGTRASASSRRSARASTERVDRRAGRAALARLRLRDLPLLRVRLGDAVRAQVNTGYALDGGLRRVRRRATPRFAVARPRRHRPRRRGTADLRRRHHLQGRQGVRPAARPSGPRSSASAVSATSPCSTPRSSAATSSAVDVTAEKLRAGPRPRRRGRGQRPRDRPGRGNPGDGRRRRRHRPRGGSRRRSSRPTPRCVAAAGWSASRCRATT